MGQIRWEAPGRLRYVWEVLVARSNLSIILITCWETALNDNCTPVLAISALYKMVLTASESQPTTPVKINYYKTVNPLSDMLLKHWKTSFIGPSFSILRDKIRDYEKAFDYYSKLLLFVQSSGTGKSWLADHFRKSLPCLRLFFSNVLLLQLVQILRKKRR